MLIQAFHHCQCADLRDKVFALVSMASEDTAIVPDYSQSACQVYLAVQAEPQFNDMLAQILGVSTQDRALHGAL